LRRCGARDERGDHSERDPDDERHGQTLLVKSIGASRRNVAQRSRERKTSIAYRIGQRQASGGL